MITYIVQSLAWSLGGFLIGWVVGRAGRDVRQIREEVMPGEYSPPRKVFRLNNVVGIIVVVLAAITMVTAVVSARNLEHATECQTRFNETYSNALAQRFQSAAAEREAQRQLIVTIAKAQGVPEPQAEAMTRRALDEYLAALDRADRQRRENPLPEEIRCP